MHGHIGAVAHGHAHVGGGQGGRVVHPVAHHGDHLATRTQFLHLRRLVTGQHIGQHFFRFGAQAQASGHGFGSGLVVARNHHQLQAAIAQRR